MITLHWFAPGLGSVQLSPPCLKAATYLRLRGIPHDYDTSGNVLASPTRMLPVVRIQQAGRTTTIADSQRIIEHFEGTHPDGGLDSGLSKAQRAGRQSVRRICDDSLYFALGHDRWRTAGPRVREHWVDTYAPRGLRSPMRPLVRRLVQRGADRIIARYSGGGHYPEETLQRWANQDLEALSTLLGAQEWVLGPDATTADASAFATLDNILGIDVDGALKRLTRRYENLCAYHRRVRAQLFE